MPLDEREQRGRIGLHRPSAAKRHEGPGTDVRAVGDGHADPALPEIDAEQRGHGSAISAVRTSTRASKVGIVPTQSGHTDSSA